MIEKMQMKKIFSAMLAASLFLGTVPIMAADGSSTPSDVTPADPSAPAGSLDVDGHNVEVIAQGMPAEIADQVNTSQKVLALLAQAGIDLGPDYSLVTYGGNYRAVYDGQEVPVDGPVDVTFQLDPAQFTPGDEVYLMEYVGPLTRMQGGDWKIQKLTEEQMELFRPTWMA